MALSDETLPLASGGTQPVVLAAGDLLDGKYELVRLLGEGGMGSVWEAENLSIGRRVAIKCLLPQAAENAVIVARFEQEARAATAIGNEHIVEVFDMGRLPDGAPYMVMEKLKGCDLEQLIADAWHDPKSAPLTLDRTSAIISQICDGLEAAHACGIVHRDMKPLNVFVTSRSDNPEFIKLLDFGISKVKGDIGSATDGMTRTGVAMGTPYYMPPEQAQGLRDLDHRADIYAVGAILYEMLTGQMPLEAESTAELLARILRDRPTPPSAMRSDLPRDIDDVVMCALEKDPRDRFDSARDLAAALRSVVDDYRENHIDSARVSAIASGAALDESTVSQSDEVDVASAAEPSEFVGDGSSSSERSSISGDSFADWHAARSSAGRWKKPALALVVVAIAGAGAFLLATRDSSPSAAPKVENPGPEAVAAAATVHVMLVVEPKDAFIYINGARFPNPLDAQQPKSLEPARITIEAAGYTPKQDVLIFDRDVQRSYKLRSLSEKAPQVDAGATVRIGTGGTSADPANPANPANPAKGRSRKPRNRTHGSRGGERGARAGTSEPALVGKEGEAEPAKDTEETPSNDVKADPDGIYRGKRGKIRDDWD